MQASESQELPPVYTYIDVPVVEQRQVYTAEDIKSEHFETLSDILEGAGVQILSYGTYGLEQKPSIRGFTDETVRVVVDGICMNNAQTGTFDFSTIDMNSVEKIEIVRGGFTEGVEDENAVGGVVYITTRKQSLGLHFFSDSGLKTFFNKDTSPASIDTFIQTLGFDGRVAENSFLKLNAKGAFAQNRYFFDYKKTDGSTVQETQEHSKVVDGAASCSFSQFYGYGNSVTLSDDFYYGDKNCPGKITGKNYGEQEDLNNSVSLNFYNPGIHLASLNATVNDETSVTRKISCNLRNIFLYAHNNRNYKDNYGPSEHRIDDFKYSCSSDFYGWKHFKFLSGFSLDCTHLDSTNSGEHFQFSGVFKETAKIYFNDIFSATIPLGVKFCGKNAAFVPKLGFAAKFSWLDVLVDGYRMIQFPNMDDLYWEGSGYRGNPDLTTEKGWGADLTFNVKNPFVPFSLEFFTNYYEDKICWTTVRLPDSGATLTTTVNAKKAFYFGIDFSTESHLIDDLIILKASGEYLYNRLLDENDPLTYGKQIMWTPDITASGSIQLNLSIVDFSVSAKYVGKRYNSNLNTSYLEPYCLINAVANLKIWRHVTPYLKAENILNESYQSIENYSMPGASLTLGVKAKW